MKDVAEDLTELAAAPDASAWRIAIEDIAEERGYFDALGRSHAALFTEAGPVLVVTFETEAAIRAREGHVPLGWTLTRPHGHSSLVLTSRGPGWFRNRQVYAYFDRLIDDGFFDEFDRVVFLGAGPGGYAAAAYSVAAPGATVIAIAPQATLTPDRAGWDRRYPDARRLDFTSRYGYAPDMLEAAAAAFVIHDPAIAEDAMHAALFAVSGAQMIRARHFGEELASILENSGALGVILSAATSGKIDAATVYRALRARRENSAWLRRLLADAEAHDAPERVERLCRHVLASGRRAPRFRRALEAARAALTAR